MAQVERDKLFTRWGALKSERSSWLTHWREISDYLLPRSGRFLATDRNKGDKRHNNIYDSTGTRSLGLLAPPSARHAVCDVRHAVCDVRSRAERDDRTPGRECAFVRNRLT